MWRQCLQAAPRWKLWGIKALIYLGNMQAKCYVIPLAHLDIRAVSLPSNQYGTVPGLISSISLIRPGRMLCWCGHIALKPWQVSLQGTALRGMDMSACWGLRYNLTLCGCLLSVQPLMNIQRWSVTEALVCVVQAGILSWGNEWSYSNWCALLCGKHVSGLCLINLQITDSSVKSQFLTPGQIPLRKAFMPCSYYNWVKKLVSHETRVHQKQGLMSPRGWRRDVFPRRAGAWGGLTPATSSSVLPKSQGEEMHLSLM